MGCCRKVAETDFVRYVIVHNGINVKTNGEENKVALYFA